MFVTLKKTNFIEYFVLKPFSERRYERSKGNHLKFSKEVSAGGKRAVRGCGLKKKPG